MKQSLSDNAIKYSWSEMLTRAGFSIKAERAYFGSLEINLGYISEIGSVDLQQGFQLVILKSDQSSLQDFLTLQSDEIQHLPVRQVLPEILSAFPVITLPILAWGEMASKNLFAEIINQKTLLIHADILAASFYLLSRFEEAHTSTFDRYGRFPYQGSTAQRLGIADIPLVDLYALALRAWMNQLTGQNPEMRHQFSVHISHDIDHIALFHPVFKGAVVSMQDLLHGQFEQLSKNVESFIDYKKDPFFSGTLRLCNDDARHGFSSTFNLMAVSPTLNDAGYSLHSKPAFEAIRTIISTGHTFGLHSSFGSLNKPNLIKKEKALLEEAVGQPIDTIRAHYLRIRTPESWSHFQSAGFKLDTSYGFAEFPGFRCGTCIPYHPFDVFNDRPFDIIEEPLIAMDTTLKHYLGLNIDKSVEMILRLASICKSVSGCFTLLWHNTSFFRDWEAWGSVYSDLLLELNNLSSQK